MLGRDEFVRLLKSEFLTPQYSQSKIHENIFLLDSRIVITPNFDQIYDVYAGSASKGFCCCKKLLWARHHADHIQPKRKINIKNSGTTLTPGKFIFTRQIILKQELL